MKLYTIYMENMSFHVRQLRKESRVEALTIFHLFSRDHSYTRRAREYVYTVALPPVILFSGSRVVRAEND